MLIVPGEWVATYERWELDGGSVALVCYSSVQVLHAACGAGQPSRWVPAADIPAQCAAAGAEAVVLDEPLPVPPRYPEADVRDTADLAPVDDQVPPLEFIYVPSRPVRRGDFRVDLELQPYRDRRALLAYTSPEALAEGCGSYQPWVAIHVDDLAEVVSQSGAEHILFDPMLDERSQHNGPVRNWR